MALRLTTEAREEVQLTVQQQTTLRRQFKQYAELKDQFDDLKVLMEEQKDAIDAIRQELGEKSIGFDGYRITEVDGGTTRTLDQKRLLAQGITLAQIEMATVETPKKGSIKITLPRSKQ